MKYIPVLFVFFLYCTHQSLPSERLYQVKLGLSYSNEKDTLVVSTPNKLHIPVLIDASSKKSSIDSLLSKDFPRILSPLSDTSFLYFSDDLNSDSNVSFSVNFGDSTIEIRPKQISLPFPKNRSYKIIQGYNGKFSHKSSYSRFALDFDLEIGDTVTVVDDGFVVGVIEGYKHGGNSSKWRDYANFITVYHPHTGYLTQYVHLVFNGSFVEVGDTVKIGQPIGLSGNTGFSSREHLHFNVLVPSGNGTISVPVSFLEGYDGRSLKKGTVVKK